MIWKIVKIDETKFFKEEFLKKHHLEKIDSVYIYREDLHYHIADLNPSYELFFVTYEEKFEDISKLPISEQMEIIHDARESLYEMEKDQEVSYIYTKNFSNIKTIDITGWLSQYEIEEGLEMEDLAERNNYFSNLLIEKYQANPIYMNI